MELSNNSDGLVAQINIVPLVDIMLVLLVIFMVTAPMMQQGVDVNLPKTATGAMKGTSQEQVVLSVDQKGDVYLGAGNKIELAELGAKVGAVLARRPDDERKVFVKADSALSYGRVMEVMGALHAGGITQVGLVSAPPDKRP